MSYVSIFINTRRNNKHTNGYSYWNCIRNNNADNR